MNNQTALEVTYGAVILLHMTGTKMEPKTSQDYQRALKEQNSWNFPTSQKFEQAP